MQNSLFYPRALLLNELHSAMCIRYATTPHLSIIYKNIYSDLRKKKEERRKKKEEKRKKKKRKEQKKRTKEERKKESKLTCGAGNQFDDWSLFQSRCLTLCSVSTVWHGEVR